MRSRADSTSHVRCPSSRRRPGPILISGPKWIPAFAGMTSMCRYALAAPKQLAQIDHGRIRPRNVIRHHERMIREEPERRAVEHHRASERILRLVQLADHLIETHHRVLVT